MSDSSTLKPFHIVVHRPDGVPVPSVASTELGGGDPEKITLKAIRDICRVPKKYAFTSDGKSSVADRTTLKYYISLTPENPDLTETEPPEQKGIPKVVINCVSTSPNKTKKELLSQSTLQKDLKDLLGSTGKPVEGLQPGKLSELVGKFDELEKTWAAKASTSEYTEAADLTEQQWENILFNNRILHGYHFTETKGFVRAPKRAFAIRRPHVATTTGPSMADIATQPNDEVKAPKPPSSAVPEASKSKVPAGLGTVKEYLNSIPGIPRFHIEDDSRVIITEMKNEFQKTLARQGFSAEATEVNAAVGAMGAAVSASASFAKENSYDKLKVNTEQTNSLHVSYSFPRVCLELDPDTLQLSDECLKDVLAIENESDVNKFFRQYGSVFPTRLTLGGCLQSTKSVKRSERGDMDAVKDETRWAAGVSFSTPKVSGGVNHANTKSTTDKEGTQTVERSALLTWEARGGDTVLCSNPPLWASTVKDYRLWRVMDQSDLQSVWELIQQIDIGAFGYISNPITTKRLNSRNDRSPPNRILSRMTSIINAGNTDTSLSLIMKNWQDVDRQSTSDFNTWLTGEGKTDLKIDENGKAWNDLSRTQKVYYGIYLQVCKNLELVK